LTKENVARICDRIAEYCIYGLIAALPVSGAAIEVFSALAILAFMVKKVLIPDFRLFKVGRFGWVSLLLFTFFMALSLLNAGPYLGKSLRALFSKWIENMFVFLAVADTFSHPRRIRNAVILFLVSSAIVSFSGLSQRFLHFEFLRRKPMHPVFGNVYAMTSSFGHHNGFAAYLITVLPFGISLGFLRSDLRYRFGIFCYTALLMICLFFTFSRGAWIGFMCGGILCLCLLHKYKAAFLLLAGFCLAIGFVPELRERVLLSFGQLGDAHRIAIWQGSLGIIRDAPLFGKGVGTFMEYSPGYITGLGAQYAHNCYLQIWAETGLLSLSCFFLFLGTILAAGKKALNIQPLMPASYVTAATMSGIIAFLVHGFFDVHFYSAQLSALFWLMAGLLFAEIRISPGTGSVAHRL
jgi:O-antigen ligase